MFCVWIYIKQLWIIFEISMPGFLLHNLYNHCKIARIPSLGMGRLFFIQSKSQLGRLVIVIVVAPLNSYHIGPDATLVWITMGEKGIFLQGKLLSITKYNTFICENTTPKKTFCYIYMYMRYIQWLLPDYSRKFLMNHTRITHILTLQSNSMNLNKRLENRLKTNEVKEEKLKQTIQGDN